MVSWRVVHGQIAHAAKMLSSTSEVHHGVWGVMKDTVRASMGIIKKKRKLASEIKRTHPPRVRGSSGPCPVANSLENAMGRVVGSNCKGKGVKNCVRAAMGIITNKRKLAS